MLRVARIGTSSRLYPYSGSRMCLLTAGPRLGDIVSYNRRTYMNQHQRPRYPPWIKPALYTAGGVAVITFTWPVLRYVMLGGLTYGAYRLFKVWLLIRRLNNGQTIRDDIGFSNRGQDRLINEKGFFASLWQLMSAASNLNGSGSGGAARWSGGSQKLVDIIQNTAQESLRQAYVNDEMVQEVIGNGEGRELELTVAEPLEMQSSIVMVDGRRCDRLEGVFPVRINSQADMLFVRASSALLKNDGVENVDVDSLTLLARLPSGEVREIPLDIDSGSQGRQGNRKPNVEDADFRDV